MLRLVIGNKRYSSWSLRPWLLMREFGIAFEAIPVRLGTPEFASAVGPYRAAGRVPLLLDGDLVVWDTLAIVEYLAERFPEHPIWPRDHAQRARARSMCAEMHAGFGALRQQLPMNIDADLAGFGWNVAVQRDIDRLAQMWDMALEESNGPFLYGAFGAVDAYFAPVASRLATYAIAVPATMGAYRDRIMALPGLAEWIDAARREPDFIPEDEPYRMPPST